MRTKKTSGALLISVVIHLLLVLIAGLYFVTQTQTFKKYIAIDVENTPEPPKPPQVQKPIIKPVHNPISEVKNLFVADPVETQPRLTKVNVKDTEFSLNLTVPQDFGNPPRIKSRKVNQNVTIKPNLQKKVKPKVSKLEITTNVELPWATSPNTIPVASQVTSLPDVNPAHIRRGAVQVKVNWTRPLGLSMTEHVGVTESALKNVVSGITLGHVEIPSNNDGDPCGIVTGRGRDIRGVFRFARVRHSLSDWWADSSALNSLANWLNEKTKIRTDMNVDGGSVKLTDANLQKSPLVFMTGHDPAFARARNLLGRQFGGGRMDNRFTEAEAAGLRKYLVEKGGFLVFDDCGVNAPAQAMVRLFFSQMRYVMPEYQVERIKNDHEIYHNFYGMGGPPVGFDIFWWGTRPPRRNYLEGISVGEKLSVLVVRRDYMCAMETVSIPTRSVHYSPGVYRFMTNVVVYALTTGGISDYSRYVPNEALTEKTLPTHAPHAARIGATE